MIYVKNVKYVFLTSANSTFKRESELVYNLFLVKIIVTIQRIPVPGTNSV